MEALVFQLKPERQADSSNVSSVAIKRPAPSSGGCRIEGFVRVKKVIYIAINTMKLPDRSIFLAEFFILDSICSFADSRKPNNLS